MSDAPQDDGATTPPTSTISPPAANDATPSPPEGGANAFLEAALRYAKLGWHVIPIQPRAKLPLTEHAYKDATTDEARIREWWTRWPNANVAVATGQSGLVVVDADPRNGAEETYRTLAKLVPNNCWDTVRARSGGRGAHFVYKAPQGIEIKSAAEALGKGIDIKASTGYILVEPSIHPKGLMYHWVRNPWEHPILPFPEEFRNLIGKGPTGTAGVPKIIDQPIPKGRRDSTLLSLAGTLRARGLPQFLIESTLLQVNREYCQPVHDEPSVIDIARRYQNGGGSNGAWPDEQDTVPDGALPDGFYPNDSGNAKRFVRDHGPICRYSHTSEQWLICNGKWWPIDETQRIIAFAKETAEKLYTLADTVKTEAFQILDSGNEKEGKARLEFSNIIRGFAKSTGNSSRLQKMLEMAQELLAVTSKDLDQHKYLINFANGTYDMKTGQLRPHDPNDLITKCIPIPYDTAATCPKWEAFIATVMEEPDPTDAADKKRFLQQAIGYSLTGSVGEQVIFFHYGAGGNGKSVFFETIRRVLGDYAMNAEAATFESQYGDRIRADLARLRGARLVTASEGEKRARVNEAIVKKITGGEPLVVEFKYQNPFEYYPEFKVHWSGNHKPIITGNDQGIWRRVRAIEWKHKFPDKDRRTLDEVVEDLLAEKEGILRWCVDGLKDWQHEDLIRAYRPVIERTIQSYRDDMNLIGEFLDTQTYQDPEASATLGDLYAAYREWCQRTGDDAPMSKNGFGRNLREQGHKQTRDADGTRRWAGIGIGDPQHARALIDQRARVQRVLEVIREWSVDAQGADISDIKFRLVSEGMDEATIESTIESLLERGRVYKSGVGKFSTI